MKRVVFFLLALLVLSASVLAADVTSPGDPIEGLPPVGVATVDGRAWPDGEAPLHAIDNVAAKYLHFKPTDPANLMGFAVTPSRAGSIVIGLNFMSANDRAERDPTSYELYGSNDSINGPWTLISSGSIADFAGATEWARNAWISAPIVFANTVAYDHYRLLFPTLRDYAGANSMQIGEVELLDGVPTVSTGTFLVRLPNNTIQLNATVSDVDTPLENITYQWSFYSGPEGVTAADLDFGDTANSATPTVTFPSVAGLYELQVQISDGMYDANDLALVRVWDSATEDALLGHWAMNDGPGSTVVADVRNSAHPNNGVIGCHAQGESPTWTPGWIPSEDPDNWALDFTNLGFVTVIPDTNNLSPNLDDVQWSISIAAWFNANGWVGNHRILQKGRTDNQYRLLVQDMKLTMHLAGVGTVQAPLPTATLWHHVVGTYDGVTMKLYMDGVEVGSQAASGLISTSTDPLFIGTKHDEVNPDQHPGDYFQGKLDDVRIYNYPLSEQEIYDLVAMGENAPPVILSIEAPAELVLSVTDSIDADATVFDVNGDQVNYQWTATGPGNVTFLPTNTVEDPSVAFDTAGEYTLRLTIDDGLFGLEGEISSEIVVNVTNPTCADAIAAGHVLIGDLDGNCSVDLGDVAVLAANWLACNDPLSDDPRCVNPFAPTGD